jgi:hypothetical protein
MLLAALERHHEATKALVEEAKEPGILARRAWAAREAEAAKAYARDKRRKQRMEKHPDWHAFVTDVQKIGIIGLALLYYGGGLVLIVLAWQWFWS